MYTTHGEYKTRLHKIWSSMKCRCLNANHPSYKRYGARGISIDPEWKDNYIAFRNWAKLNGYADDLELDRIDVNGNYEPTNCRWITHHEQTLNRRDTLYIQTPEGIEKIRDFCARRNISINTINDWRHRNVLEEKLSARLTYPIKILGGKKVVKNEIAP